MGRISIHNMDFDDMDEEFGRDEKFKKTKRNGTNESSYGENLSEPQGKSPRRRKSDSYISKRTKGRSRNTRSV